jgi:nucleoside-diphosphate-sugar epimerase
MATQRRAVVTGGAGFIGSHLVDGLLGEGYEVHIIDNLSGGKMERVNKDAHFHNADIRHYNEIAPIISGADVVFHLAALPRVQYSIDEPIETNDVNAGGTLNVLHASKEGGVRRVVYSASSSAYGDSPVLPLHEELPAKPVSPYGLQKYIGEEYARLYAELHGLSTVSLRYFNVYGTRMDPDGAYALVIGKFLKMRKEGKTLTITGDGEQTRDFTHIEDVVRANLLSAKSTKVGHGEVINIGSGTRISMNMLAKMIGGSIEYIEARKESLHTLADNKKAKQLLGWEPTIFIEEGIATLRKEWGV